MNGSNSSIAEKLTDIVDWLTQKRWQATSSPAEADMLYTEINQLKKALSSNAPTRPSRVVRSKPESLEPVTEQQKILDLAG